MSGKGKQGKPENTDESDDNQRICSRLVEWHPRRRTLSGGRKRIDLDEACSVVLPPADDLLALDEALTRLATRDPVRAELVKLHCFAGLSIEQAAEVLGLSPRTAYRDWAFARAWLYRAIHDSEPPAKD